MLPARRFLVLFLPTRPTDYLKRRDGKLTAPRRYMSASRAACGLPLSMQRQAGPG
ncbi:hypothetical protein N8D56_04790 [Devosia sp. A8/3-2]|nr:hypothetical protein N8D56_04790 [Devosia sp. A8/3-2]